MPSMGFPPGIGVNPLGKTFLKLAPGKKPPEPDVLIKGNPPQFENLALRGVTPGKGVLTHGNLNPPDILLHPY
jgi:hypothetical protein